MLVNRHIQSNGIQPLDSNGNQIYFVDQFKLLGLVIDSKLSFEQHIAQIKKKYISKAVLSQGFDRYFLLSSVLHSSSCSFYRISTTPRLPLALVYLRPDLMWFLRCFHRCLRTSLRFKVSSRLDLPSQQELLKPLGILPLKLRWFERLCIFIFKSFKNGRPKSLLNRYERVVRSREVRGDLNSAFLVPRFSLERYGRVSFLRISTYLLNSFIFKFISLQIDANSSFSAFLSCNLSERYDKFFKFIHNNGKVNLIYLP